MTLTISDGTFETSDTATLTLYDPSYAYVAIGGNGDGANPGSPIGDIQGGIEAAAAASRPKVAVASGAYTVTYGTNHIVMQPGVSIIGGYQRASGWQHDSSSTTSISDDYAGPVTGSATAPIAVIEAGTTVTDSDRIEGFTIYPSPSVPSTSGNFYYVSGIRIHGGGYPTVQNNTITCPDTSLRINYYGIHMYGNTASSPVIQNNTIYGGSANYEQKFGVYVNDTNPLISNNVITGGGPGTGSTVTAIMYSSGAGNVTQNTITGSATGGLSGTAFAVHVANGTPTIYNNLIGGSKAGNVYVIYSQNASAPIIRNNTILLSNSGANNRQQGITLDDTAAPVIENNLIFSYEDTSSGKVYGVYEENSYTGAPASFKNNYIYVPASISTWAFYRDYSGAAENLRQASADLNDQAKTTQQVGTASGNSGTRTDDIAFQDPNGGDANLNTLSDNDWSLTAASNAAILTGGFNGAHTNNGFGYSTDFLGDPRSPADDSSTTGWSIGAIEY